MTGKEMLPRPQRILIIHPKLHGFRIIKDDANDHCAVGAGIPANGIPNFMITVYLNSKTKNKVYYADSTADLEKIIKGFTRIKTLLFVGAGDIYEIAKNLTDKK